ncbi:hypothetical protein PISMIDRAFT_476904 [Pisolithus microcarpus 441]|uniref:Transmembrane protein n=1 Tax=Pisolithus microcarpus 441 TaxID=765257 RepID=A0A0C9ZA83_9AGAM|nr:hypothetical protein PISMIDRAFT_476904 [Pisolithus microcarpus 441]
MYSVSLFLYNLHVRARPLKNGGRIPHRLCQVFCISLANFVFPLAFNITLLIFVMTDYSLNTGAGLLLLINNYVTVIGVLCATIWSSRLDTRKEPLSDEILQRKLNLLRAPASGGMGGGEIVVIGTRALTLDPWQV